MIRVRYATCLADCTGKLFGRCQDVAEPAARRAARTFIGCFAGRFPGHSAYSCADVARLAALSLIRGWCLTKMTGFSVPESRQRSRSFERWFPSARRKAGQSKRRHRADRPFDFRYPGFNCSSWNRLIFSCWLFAIALNGRISCQLM